VHWRTSTRRRPNGWRVSKRFPDQMPILPKIRDGRAGLVGALVKVSSSVRRYYFEVVEDVTTFRNKEQVLHDLSKALHFSPESLEANRKGRLSRDQVKQFAPRCIQPAVLTVVFAVAPFAIWTWITAGRQQLSMGNAFPVLLTELTHVQDLFEAHGKIGGVMMLASILISLALAAIMVFRMPLSLYIDLLDRKVEAREGRVVAREEQINRANGRDPIEKYFFSLRYLNMPVSLAAYRALEAGSVYIVYVLPRSEVLASIEPKLEDAAVASPPPASLHRDEGSPSPSERAS
jgi:hypothetical protein